jgi:hypothetical protein
VSLADLTPIDPLPEAVARSAAALVADQRRVNTLVAVAAGGDGWHATLRPADQRRLVRMGHFPTYSAELGWTAGDVAGHLRDSARIFTHRLRRMCNEKEPPLADFVTDDRLRLADYRSTPPARLAEQLLGSQAELLQTVVGIGSEELDRAGVHAVDGRITVADILVFLPGHQRDHAEQLAAMLA